MDFRSKQQEVRLLGPHLGGEKDGLENVEEGKTSDGEKPLGQTLKCTEKGCDFRADVEGKRRGGETQTRYIYFVIACRYSEEDLTAVAGDSQESPGAPARQEGAECDQRGPGEVARGGAETRGVNSEMWQLIISN